ncbi:response regulator transcription factor [Convivina praedatoris]|uniref:Response regulator protein GraR n=1 Tax=Convivina praedatoris TaxID=2880963 RepID=A0ABM9D2T5_9LACO|nr:response regulator transcription factor [Convivina sp. LMG 32447]CAH1851892.1 Response regulator protein GraR [Convivina sp. LMG 32447]CAH1851926.1 Response regulator protein GraR [Convivina sp. LMG 32447]CAH1852974.1 Response regulator protein GraR [Convivina sp. LMG 32447]
MSKVFLVEDDPTIRENIRTALNKWQYEVIIVQDWNQVVSEIMAAQVDLVLMDITLPIFDGFHWTEELRKQSQVPIIFISSADMNPNAVRAIATGADDYVTKPFVLDVLISKVQAILRRVNQYNPTDNSVLDFDGSTLSTLTNELNYGDATVKLTPTEGYILQLLILNLNQIVSKTKIMRMLWQGGAFIDEDVLNTNISRLRSKMKTVDLPDRIITERGQGYRLVENDL